MAAPEIRALYQDVTQAATRLGELMAQAQDVLNDLNSNRDPLSGEWIGFGYDSFADEVDNEVFPAVKDLVSALEKGQIQMTDIATKFEETESTDGDRIKAIQAPSLITS